MKSIAIMQPYFCPHIGYFQLVSGVDVFVFYDDVNFIKRGWVNRNYITINNQLQRFTVPLKSSSQNKKINEIEVNWDCKEMTKLIKTFKHNLKSKPIAINIIEEIIQCRPNTIADMAISSIKLASQYLNISTKFERSSNLNYKRYNNKVLNLVNICKLKKLNNYVNAEGGQLIYTKQEFLDHDVNLQFIKGLSSPSILEIIDDKETEGKLNQYEYI